MQQFLFDPVWHGVGRNELIGLSITYYYELIQVCIDQRILNTYVRF